MKLFFSNHIQQANRVSLLAVSFLLLVFYCINANAQSTSGELKKNWRYKPLLQQFVGVWRETGTGRIFHISDDSLVEYAATKKTCSIGLRFDDINDINQLISKVRGNAHQGRLWITAKGDKGVTLRFNRINELPAVCQMAPDPSVFDPEFIFDHAWHLFNDYYPFFSLRGVEDWQQQYDAIRPTVSANSSSEELFLSIATMLSPLDDGHIGLTFIDGQNAAEYSPAKLSGWGKYVSELAESQGEDESVIISNIIKSFNNRLAKKYTESNKTHFNKIDSVNSDIPALAWTILEGNIGYLQVNDMGGDLAAFKEGELLNIKRSVRVLNRAMNRAMRDLGNTESLIIDVRFNPGGHDQVALALASRFADTKRVAFRKEKFNQGNKAADKRRVDTYHVRPHRKGGYTKPIVLITGPDTGSAAEIFTMAMRSLPHVTHIGEATQGILSDILPVTLADNWGLGLSHEIYYDAQGAEYEDIGIPPYQIVSVTDRKAISKGVFPAVEFALDTLKKQ